MILNSSHQALLNRLDPPTVYPILSAELRVEALQLAERTFGHLDLGGSTVANELKDVIWQESMGIFSRRAGCLGFLLMAPGDLPGFLEREKSGLPFRAEKLDGLRGIRGDALVVTDAGRPAAGRMFSRFLANTGYRYDYVWGTAHQDLDNMGFWRRHAHVLGKVGDSWTFAAPLTPTGAEALKAAMAEIDPQAPRFIRRSRWNPEVAARVREAGIRPTMSADELMAMTRGRGSEVEEHDEDERSADADDSPSP